MASPYTKSEVCRALASLLHRPQEDMGLALASGEVFEVLSSYFPPEEPALTLFRNTRHNIDLLSCLYTSFFDNHGVCAVSLVESSYKPWTRDPACALSEARQTGYVMGDSALHLLALYEYCGASVPEGYEGRPDHIVLELDFLAFLYDHYRDEEVYRFLVDHLDWVGDLVRAGAQAGCPPFYASVLELVYLFVKKELETRAPGRVLRTVSAREALAIRENTIRENNI